MSGRIASCVWLAILVAAGLGVWEAKASGWPVDPNQSVAICTQKQKQEDPAAVSDGHGGAIVVWTDDRSWETHYWRGSILEYSGTDIYAQRVDSRGNVMWAMDGVPICAEYGNQLGAVAVSDGIGGAIIAWIDKREETTGAYPGVYAQRVSISGTVQWAYNGVPLWTAEYAVPHSLGIVSDGASGAIVVWQEYEVTMAQRIDWTGAVQWPLTRVGDPTGSRWSNSPVIASDSAGGAIVAWDTYTVGIWSCGIYAQRLDPTGRKLWISGGIKVCDVWDEQRNPAICPDGTGGAIIAWDDGRKGYGGDDDIFAMRVDASGNAKWRADGVSICSATGDQDFPAAIPDGGGGVFLIWCDLRGGGRQQSYVQHVDSAGNALWSQDGILVGQVSDRICTNEMLTIGTSGVIVAWHDTRPGHSGADVFAQRLNLLGDPQWPQNGVTVSSAALGQWSPVIVPTGFGGAIIVWEDERNWRNTGIDIHAQAINHLGELGQVAASATAVEPRSLAEVLPTDEVATVAMPTVDWVSVPDSYYHLQVADNPFFLSPDVDEPLLSSNQFTLEGLPPGTYYWRVMPISSMPGSDDGEWSPTGSVVVPTELGTGTLQGPLQVSFTARSHQTCGAYSHEVQVSWELTGGSPPYEIAIEVTGPEGVADSHVTSSLSGQWTLSVSWPAGGQATIVVTARDATGTSTSSRMLSLPPC